jgi:hypothetical protein
VNGIRDEGDMMGLGLGRGIDRHGCGADWKA